jgi:hypothetical protein
MDGAEATTKLSATTQPPTVEVNVNYVSDSISYTELEITSQIVQVINMNLILQKDQLKNQKSILESTHITLAETSIKNPDHK